MTGVEEFSLERGAVEGPVGLFGGSFDPPHVGHLIMALDALERGGLGRVFFVPAARSPLKSWEAGAGPVEREEMVRLAIMGQPRFSILDWELEAGGTSYTIDTVRRFRERFPQAEPHWILGADQYAQLKRWHLIDELVRLADFLVVARPGAEDPAPDLPTEVRVRFLPMRQIDLSSTEVRQRCAAGLPLTPFVPTAVAGFIKSRRLYGCPEE